CARNPYYYAMDYW
nr:immunoglobulin heavy chain junction region [Mus musculus]